MKNTNLDIIVNLLKVLSYALIFFSSGNLKSQEILSPSHGSGAG
jgi:hypothetical protein